MAVLAKRLITEKVLPSLKPGDHYLSRLRHALDSKVLTHAFPDAFYKRLFCNPFCVSNGSTGKCFFSGRTKKLGYGSASQYGKRVSKRINRRLRSRSSQSSATANLYGFLFSLLCSRLGFDVAAVARYE